jgi:Ser-tRNA(Ala) deacylase AlaX
MPTDCLFREDSYLKDCQSRVLAITEQGGIVLDLDLQPCGGTHVRATGEIGPVRVTQIEKKGKQNRRVRLAFA